MTREERAHGGTIVPVVAAGERRRSGPTSPAAIGGKAHGLLRLADAGVDVPPWFAIGAAAFERLVLGDRPWPETPDAAKARRAEVRALDLPPDFRAAVLDALEAASLAGAPLAVRSSAVGEDAGDESYAGQFESVLGVVARADDADALWEAIRRVWASAFDPRVAAYRAARGAGGAGPVRMGVVVQRLVDAEAAGVAFSADPVTGDRTVAVVSAVYGLAEALVAGEVEADTYRVGEPGAAVGRPSAGAAAGKAGSIESDVSVGGDDGSDEAGGSGGGSGDGGRTTRSDADPVRTTVASKAAALRVARDGGVASEPVAPDRRRAPAITEDEARRIARTARRLEAAFGAAQDIEWALTARAEGGVAVSDGRRLWVLQARPITTLESGAGGDRRGTRVVDGASARTGSVAGGEAATDAARVAAADGGGDASSGATTATPTRGGDAPASAPAPSGERRIWDNSNIIESYSGVTTPLTFSFARAVYEEVYRQFCGVMGVDDALIDRHRHVFANMLGLIRGRVYYNLLNWYRMLALLPGFTLNRAFMERMMGVAEALDDPPEPPRAATRREDAVRVVRTTYRMLREHRRLGRRVPAFREHVDAVVAPLQAEDFTTWPAGELVGLYRRLEDELLRRWQTPIVNDFFAMIWFGVLGRLAERWVPEAGPTLVNDLLCGGGDIVSAEPAVRITALARRVGESPELSELFANEPDDDAVWRRLAEDPAFAAFHAELRAYLDRFGDRCMGELKLETVTLSEDPGFLVRLVRRYAERDAVEPADARERERAVRRAAEELVGRRLGGVRRRVFMAVVERTRRRVRDRENLRFERTRVFGVVRRVFVGIGHALTRARRIDSPRDVFHLTVDELFSYADGAAVTAELHALVALRRAAFDAYRASASPPDRFETYGPPGDAWVGPQDSSFPGGPGTAGDAGVAGDPEAVSAGAAVTTDAMPAANRAADADGGAGDDRRLHGIGCCAGVVRAPVAVVRDPREAPDLDGRILVAERTDPGWTLLFPAASGLLVERGSLLSHSAIVAREMGIPCIVAIPGLLGALEEGEVVEMDGATGEVRRGGGTGEAGR